MVSLSQKPHILHDKYKAACSILVPQNIHEQTLPNEEQ